MYLTTACSTFKARTDSSVLSPESPSPSTKPRRSLTSKIKDTTESLRSRSKSRERAAADRAASGSLKKDSKNKGVFSSTLSLFKKRERKKSYDEAIAASCGTELDASGGHPSLESIGHVEFRFNAEKDSRKDDSIFISLHADDRNYEEALPSESVSIPLETPTKLLDEYESEPRTGSIVTEVSIEHYPPTSRIKTEALIETTSRAYSRDSQAIPQSASRDSEISRSSSKDSKLSSSHARTSENVARSSSIVEGKPPAEHRVSSSSSKDSIGKKEATKPKRKSKEPVQQPVHQPPDRTEEDPVAARQQQKQKQTEGTRSEHLAPVKAAEKRPDLLDDGIKPADGLVKTPSVISDLDRNSSESERDSEIEFVRNKVEKLAEELPDERKGLFYEESFEEDLPYVPTTLPLEKSVAMPILPVKQRLQEVR